MSLIKEALDRSEKRRNGKRQLTGVPGHEDYQFSKESDSDSKWAVLTVLIVILATALGSQLVVLLTFLWS